MQKESCMKLIAFTLLITSYLNAAENLASDSVKISKKIITINQEALRAPASVEETDSTNAGEETLSEAMEKVEEPKLWFNP